MSGDKLGVGLLLIGLTLANIVLRLIYPEGDCLDHPEKYGKAIAADCLKERSGYFQGQTLAREEGIRGP